VGRPPKPTQLKVLAGDRKDRINTQEPMPSEGDVRAPRWLSKEARRFWRSLAPDRIRKNVLTPWDVEAFANFCDALARRLEAAGYLDKQGAVMQQPIFNKDGEVMASRQVVNKWAHVWKAADEQVQRYGAKFGFTPADRARIKIEEPGETRKRDKTRLLS
jgi:P27 family predicted phage terminase small subunit